MLPINTIKSFVKDFSRPNRYWVQISIPIIMQNDPLSRNLPDIQMNCNSATFPSVSLGTAEHRVKGPIRKMPNDMIYNDMNLTFYNSSDFKERKFFEHWINSIVDKDTKNFEYYDNYTAFIIIAQFDNAGQMTHSIRLNEAYPTNVGDISLGYDNSDQIEIFPVTITYRNWVEIKASNPLLDIARVFIADKFKNFF